MRISSLSKEYITVSVTANVVVTDDPVAWAFVEPGAAPSVWTAGDWAGGRARVLVGPGVLALTAGRKEVWLKVTDNPEVPVRRIGEIDVY